MINFIYINNSVASRRAAADGDRQKAKSSSIKALYAGRAGIIFGVLQWLAFTVMIIRRVKYMQNNNSYSDIYD